MSFATRRSSIGLVASVVMLALVAACNGQAPSEVNVSLDTFSIKLSSATAKAGEVTFHIQNVSTDMAHEFAVVITNQDENSLTMDTKGLVDMQPLDQPFGSLAALKDIDLGQSGDLTINLAPGNYVLICNMPGHYKGGMHAQLSVMP